MCQSRYAVGTQSLARKKKNLIFRKVFFIKGVLNCCGGIFRIQTRRVWETTA
jgi:hypothetical protein